MPWLQSQYMFTLLLTTPYHWIITSPAGKRTVTHVEIIHINQNHFNAIEPINLIYHSRPTIMAVHEQGIID